MANKMVILCLLTSIYFNSKSQNIGADTLNSSINKTAPFTYKSFIVPAVMIGYGIWGVNYSKLNLVTGMHGFLLKDVVADDFMQYSPYAALIALGAFGAKGRNDIKHQTTLVVTTVAIMASSVLTVKRVAGVQRPDRTTYRSFPSGHTATAFAGAELLYQEYKDVSVWIGVAGYAAAATTGALRIYHNRHWFSDVMAGAGFGIASARIAYLLNPYINRLIFKNTKQNQQSAMLYPYSNGEQFGMSLAINL